MKAALRLRARVSRMTASPNQLHRPGAIRWSTLVFLIVFTILLIVVTSYVLIPGLEAVQDPKKITDEERRNIQAWYRLLLFVLLFILFAGIVITFRFGRFFFPRTTAPRTQTQYVDAWAESARRMQVPEDSDGDDDDDDDDDPPAKSRDDD
jgi:hypothetical protein